MSNCKRIQMMIDEAEQPTVLPFAATDHVASCAPCRTFADDRARLRSLLGAMPRVSAPAHFDTRLKARLGDARTPKAFSWFSPAGFARFGAAAAVLVIGVFAAQYSGVFSVTTTKSNEGTQTAAVDTQGQDSVIPQVASPGPQPIVNPSQPSSQGENEKAPAAFVSYGNRRGVQAARVKSNPRAESDDMYVPMVIVQRNNGTANVPMLPVSVGAQQRMMNRSGGVSAQPIGVSF